MTQDIWKISILYQKTSKVFYHHLKFWKNTMGRFCEICSFLPCFAKRIPIYLILGKKQIFL